MGISTRKADRHEVVAAKAIMKTATFGVRPKPREIITNVLAVILMREVAPERFKDDRAFIFQVGRRFIGLNQANATVLKTGSTVYKPLKAAAMEILGTFLLRALGEAGLSLVSSIQRNVASVQVTNRIYRDTVAKLAPPTATLEPIVVDDDNGPKSIRAAHLKWLQQHTERSGRKRRSVHSGQGTSI